MNKMSTGNKIKTAKLDDDLKMPVPGKIKIRESYSCQSWVRNVVLTFSHYPIFFLLVVIPVGCTAKNMSGAVNDNCKLEQTLDKVEAYNHLTTKNYVSDIVNHPAFKGFGELMLPRDNNSVYYNTMLSDIGLLMPYHSHVEPNDVAGALNHMIDEVNAGKTIFYDFYTDEQKKQDPGKRNTGLFFFRGNTKAPFAIVCPGGGFSYVGSLHEGFPLAQRISESGLNAFVLRYRIGSERHATEDLAAVIAYIFHNAETLGVNLNDYSVWGGSAGARMAGNIALEGVSAYGGGNLPKPATAVIAYTGQSSYSSDFSPVFITVAANDGIANVNTVERRVENLRNAGVDVEYRRYQSAGHGFGLGTGTDAEGWVDLAIRFWQRHIDE
jgi:acetyl esterase/lipase